MNMPKTTITIGLLLIAQGVGFYLATDARSATALIPAFFGLPILLLGCLALKDSLRMHAMHGAAALALLGLIAPIVRIASAGLKLSAAGGALVLMIALCGALLALTVKSFVDARLRRAKES